MSVIGLFAAANFLAGCATAPRSSAAKADDEETVLVHATGSMLPRRIKKSQAAQENLTVEGADSPTLNQIEKKGLLDQQKAMQAGSGPK